MKKKPLSLDNASICEQIIKEALKLGVEEAAVVINSSLSRQVRFANNKITISKTWDSLEASVLIVKEKKQVICAVSEFSKGNIERTLEDSLKMMKLIDPVEKYVKLPPPSSYKQVRNCYDSKIANLASEAGDIVEKAINASLNEGAERTAGTLKIEARNIYLATTSEVEAEYKSTAIILDLRAIANKDAEGHGNTCATNLNDFKPEKAGSEAGRDAVLSLNSKTLKEGKYDTVLGRAAVGTLLDYLTLASSAFYVDAGYSFFANKIGKKVASKKLTIHDIGNLPGGLNSIKFDYEGYPTRKTTIIKEGKLNTFLHNRITAKKFNTESTANAGWIIPRSWNLVIEPGKREYNELIEEIKRGLIIKNTTYTRFQNYAQGDFSSIPRDGVYYVEKGEIKHAVKGLRLSENMINLMENIEGLTKEREQTLHWWMEMQTPILTPIIYAKNLHFTKPTK